MHLYLQEEVRAQAHQDAVTGLVNEQVFLTRYHARLEAPEASKAGALMLVKLNDFSQYNDHYGREQGDVLLKQIAGRVQQTLESFADGILGKRSGAEFIIYLHLDIFFYALP